MIKENPISAWQRLLGLLKVERNSVKQIFYYAIFSGLVSLSLPLGIQAIINLIQGAQISTSWIVLVVLVTLGVAFNGVLQIMQIRIVENIQQRIFTRASFEFAYRFPKMKLSALQGVYPPELANRFFDTMTVQKSLSKVLVDYPTALLQIIFGLILLSFYHPFFIIYGLLLVVIVYILFKITGKKGLDSSLKESKSKYKVAHWLQEIARSMVSFKMSGNTKHAIEKNDNLTMDYLKYRENHFNVIILQAIQLIGFKVLVTAGLLIIGGLLVLNQQMNIGQFVAAELVILIIIAAMEKLISGLESVYDMLTSLEKIAQVVDTDLEKVNGEQPFEADGSFNLNLDDVSYSVPGRPQPILKNINVQIPAKGSLLIQGANGSGKTTLLKLMTGMIEPTSGNVYVNNIDLKGINKSAFRSKIGQTLTEESPFEGTLRNNITFGNPDITDTAIYNTLEKVALLDFLKSLPDGLNTQIVPEGKHLSKTISNKIILARALARNPKLLILKDPLEQMELSEARQIISFIFEPQHEWSVVVVSQNDLWQQHCQQTVIMDKGTII